MLNGLPRVFFGELPPSASRGDLLRLLSKYADVKTIMLKKGFGFVEFGTLFSAERCVRDFDSREFQGSNLRVEIARGTRRERGFDQKSHHSSSAHPDDKEGAQGHADGFGYNGSRSRGYSVLVKNCPAVAWQKLKDFFRPYGTLKFANVFPARREGVVEFDSERDAKHVVDKLSGTELFGETIYLRLLRRSSSTNRSRSHSRSRSRSRSKSRSVSPAHRHAKLPSSSHLSSRSYTREHSKPTSSYPRYSSRTASPHGGYARDNLNSPQKAYSGKETLRNRDRQRDRNDVDDRGSYRDRERTSGTSDRVSDKYRESSLRQRYRENEGGDRDRTREHEYRERDRDFNPDLDRERGRERVKDSGRDRNYDYEKTRERDSKRDKYYPSDFNDNEENSHGRERTKYPNNRERTYDDPKYVTRESRDSRWRQRED